MVLPPIVGDIKELKEVPNFLKASRQEVRNWLKSPIAWWATSPKKQGILLAYGLLTFSILGFFILFQILNNSAKLLAFPKELVHTISDLIHWDFSHSHFDLTWISIFIFYYILINSILKQIKKLFRSKTS